MTTKEIAGVLANHEKWLKGEGGRRANLSDANLSDANLSRANLSRANLSDANLSRANLSDANLSDANLSDANLSRANLSRANLSRANLSGAYLNWQSHTLLSEILWRAADSTGRQMLAAFVGRKTEWCWRDWRQFNHPETPWAVAKLAKWVHPGENIPKELAEHLNL